MVNERVSIFNKPKPGHSRPEHHRGPRPPRSVSPDVQVVEKPNHVIFGSSSFSIAPKPLSSANAESERQRATRSPSSDFSFTEIPNPLIFGGPSLPFASQPTNAQKPSQNISFPPRPEQAGRPRTSSSDFSFLEIPNPLKFGRPSVPAAPRPLFSTANSTRPVNAYVPPGHNSAYTSKPSKPANGYTVPTGSTYIDLTKKDNDEGFNPDRALGIRSYDPSLFLDAEKASDNIKALLEGAFEDEDDKPRTRRGKKKAQIKKDTAAADALADSLINLKVADAGEDASQDSPHDEDEEEDDGTVEGLNIKLLPHQIDGVAWMLDREIGTRKKNGVLPRGGILADDMGLGKTIQALSLILTNRRPSADDLAENTKLKVPSSAGKGTLVVAPLALIKQWEGEIQTRVDTFPKLRVLVHHGPSRTKRYEDLKKYDIVITTYQTLTSEHANSSDKDDGLKVGCFGVHWYRVMLDEAHSIKNRNAKMTKAAYDLKAVYRWCLTGTPMQNNLDELQSLIRFLRIKPYCDLASWREQIGQPMKNGRGGLAMKRLQYFLKAFMKRRTKDVLKKEGGLNFGKGTIPNGQEKTEGFKIVGRDVQTITVDFNASEREFYDRLEARTEINLERMMGGEKTDYIGALVLLLRLRQTCNHPELINAKKGKVSVISSQNTDIPSTPRRQKSSNSDDLDDVAEMLGAMTVNTQTCNGCGSILSREKVTRGITSCDDCEEDIKRLRRDTSHQPGIKKKKAKEEPRPMAPSLKKIRRIIDSDDEDEDDPGEWMVRSHSKKPTRPGNAGSSDSEDDDEDDANGEWIVRSHSKEPTRLGRAGGSEDEDAEGGGDSLGEEDSDTEDEEDEDEDDSEVSDSDADSSENGVLVNGDPRMIASTKIRRLLEILSAESDAEKFIVFSEFTSMLDIIEPFLRNAGLRFTRYDGSMKNTDREASLDRLRNDRKTRILLCSLRCGSLGLNLTAASRVVILEPFWNPFVEEQAIDRVHRLNQTRDVIVYRLTVANSVEERILALQDKKRELAQAAVEGGDKAVGKLSMRDILRLFKRDAEHDPSHEDLRTAALTNAPALLVDARGRA